MGQLHLTVLSVREILQRRANLGSTFQIPPDCCVAYCTSPIEMPKSLLQIRSIFEGLQCEELYLLPQQWAHSLINLRSQTQEETYTKKGLKVLHLLRFFGSDLCNVAIIACFDWKVFTKWVQVEVTQVFALKKKNHISAASLSFTNHMHLKSTNFARGQLTFRKELVVFL